MHYSDIADCAVDSSNFHGVPNGAEAIPKMIVGEWGKLTGVLFTELKIATHTND